MNNDFEAKMQYEGRYQDLLKEAQGGWQLQAAWPDSEFRQPRIVRLKRVLPLIWALAAAAFVALVAAAAMAALKIA